MAYCVHDDIIGKLDTNSIIQLTDDAKSGSVDATVLAACIADADARIDKDCGAKYTVPFTTVPALVKSLSVRITIYNLYNRRRGASRSVVDDYKQCLETLKEIGSGVITLSEVSESTGRVSVRVFETEVSGESDMEFSGDYGFDGFEA